MDEKQLKKALKAIRNGYAGYPKNDTTVDEMILQGLRSGYVRGIRDGNNGVEASDIKFD